MKPRHRKKRSKIKSTHDRLRLSVYRSNINIYAQIIDDENGITLLSASSLKSKNNACIKEAQIVGAEVGKLAMAKKIKKVIFDRGNYVYKGQIKALADAAREAGLDF